MTSAFAIRPASHYARIEACDDRHVAVHDEDLDQRGIRIDWIADKAEIDGLARRGPIRTLTYRTAKTSVDSSQPDRGHSATDERRHQIGVRRSGQHRDNRFERRRVGDPTSTFTGLMPPVDRRR